jgi:hypothetical protein
LPDNNQFSTRQQWWEISVQYVSNKQNMSRDDRYIGTADGADTLRTNRTGRSGAKFGALRNKNNRPITTAHPPTTFDSIGKRTMTKTISPTPICLPGNPEQQLIKSNITIQKDSPLHILTPRVEICRRID